MKRLKNVMLRSVLAGAIVGAPPAVALAANQPAPEAELSARPKSDPALLEHQLRGETAQAKAEEYRRRAEKYRRMGGVAYKAGFVQDAEAKAAKYEREAKEAFVLARGETPPVLSAEAQHYLRLAEQYRRMGGIGHKTGLVAWAEAQARKHGAPPSAAQLPVSPTRRPWTSKPIEEWLQRVK